MSFKMFVLLLLFVKLASINCCDNVSKVYDPCDKTVVVTGGAQGIGLSIANYFLYESAKVIIILDIDVKKGKQAVGRLNNKYGEDKAVFIEYDVTKELTGVYNQIIAKFSYIDIFVNNAGFINEFCVRKTIETMLLATIQWSLKVREHMRTDKGGRGGTIINISSITGFDDNPFIVVYKSAKYGVLGFSKSLGHEYNYKSTGVRVVALCPGVTDTRLGKNIKVWSEQRDTFIKLLNTLPHQCPDAVGKAAVQVYRRAKTGTAWDISDSKPPIEGPASVTMMLSDIE